MTRSFSDERLQESLLEELLDLARSAPSAGNTQATEFVVLSGTATSRFWDCTLHEAKRAKFPWPGLLSAPVLVVPLASRQAYLDRYVEPDKAGSVMGADPGTWPVPYWDIDCAFATMTLLLAATDRGLGALFFAIVEGRARLLEELGVPATHHPIGAVALGWPLAHRASTSAGRPTPGRDDVVHWGRYGQSR